MTCGTLGAHDRMYYSLNRRKVATRSTNYCTQIVSLFDRENRIVGVRTTRKNKRRRKRRKEREDIRRTSRRRRGRRRYMTWRMTRRKWRRKRRNRRKKVEEGVKKKRERCINYLFVCFGPVFKITAPRRHKNDYRGRGGNSSSRWILGK
jgi:hypothetical protein